MTTKITLGPLLGIESNHTYTFIILLHESSKIPKLYLREKDNINEENSIEYSFKQSIGIKAKYTLYRFEVDSHRMDVHFLKYSFKIEDELLIDAHSRSTWQFKVISQNEIPNIAFVSCNGHHGQYPQPKNNEHYKGWQMMLEAKPDYLFLTGDQVYTDSLFNDIQELKGYLDGKKDMLDEAVLHDAIIKLYIDSWSNLYLSEALATIPNVMTWDDHDIIDGYGSHRMKYDQILKPIFYIAKVYYELFQIRTSKNKTLLHSSFDYSMYLRLRNYDFIIPDTRSHRTQNQIIPIAVYGSFQSKLDKIQPISNNNYAMCYILPVPVAHKDYFGWFERLANWIGDRFKFKRILADDLIDHWDHDFHEKEQEYLLDFIYNNAKRLNPKNVIIASGDVHASGASKITKNENDKSYFVTQIISSPIVNKSSKTLVNFLPFFSSNFRKIGDYTCELIHFGTYKVKHIAARNFIMINKNIGKKGGISLDAILYMEDTNAWSNKRQENGESKILARKVNDF